MSEKNIIQMREELREFYFKKVRPNLDRINNARKINSRNIYGVLSFLIGLAWLSLFGKLEIDGQNYGSWGFLFFVISLLIFAFNKVQGGKFFELNVESRIKSKLMPEFLDIFNSSIKWSNNNVYKTLMDLNVYKKLNIMNPHILLTFDDNIWGRYNDVNFNIIEADTSFTSMKNLLIYLAILLFMGGFWCFLWIITFLIFVTAAVYVSKSYDNNLFLIIVIAFYFIFLPIFILAKILNNVPFRGVLVEYEMNKNFEGHTFILERSSTSSSVKFDHSKFEEVKLEDPEFMEKYIVYSDNQVEARYILTTTFIERFKNMKMAFKAKFIRAAFKDGKITIGINAGRDLFAMANFNKDTDSNTFTELFDELLSVFELINALKLNQKIGL